MKKVYKAEVQYQKGYWNRVARAHIPGGWRGEIIEGLEDLNNEYATFRVYSDGNTREEVIEDLKYQLQQLGLHGQLKIL